MSALNLRVARTVAGSGIDWVLFDTEHGPPSFETVDGLVRAVCGVGAVPLVRVVWNDINAIKQALDTGALGVVVPWVNSKEEAEAAVSYCLYAPEGLRGCAPGRAASAWGVSTEEYLATVNDEVLVAVQIETAKAVENVEEIVAVEGVDATFIGPSDLSASLGYRGKYFHPEVVKAMDQVLEACEAAGIAPGIAFGRGVDHLNSLIEQGFRFIG
ncbi:MAG: HpcH/HpaI aldolase/citrate lyase family protein, partial [Candidatus Bathyarchaeia archaeon]